MILKCGCREEEAYPQLTATDNDEEEGPIVYYAHPGNRYDMPIHLRAFIINGKVATLNVKNCIYCGKKINPENC